MGSSKKRDIEGYIAIYENTGCKVGNKLVHQPYFRWIAIPPETQSISANADYELSKNVMSVWVKKTLQQGKL